MARASFRASLGSIRRNFNLRLTCTVMVLCCSQFNFGFDVAAFNSITAMVPFQEQFGNFNTKTQRWYLEPSWLSLFQSLQNITMMFGVLIGSMISKRFGRRWCVFSMSISSLVWTTITITSRNRWQMLAGRTLSYIYMGMDLSVIPIFQAEITPAQNRGFTVGTYQFIVAVSQVVANGICHGTNNLTTNAAWRIPVGLFYWPPVIVSLCIWFLPETPRWLALQNRREEALESLRLLRRGKFTDEEIEAEFDGICEALDNEARMERGTIRECFKRGPNLRRTWIVVTLNCFLAGTGTNFANSYGAYFIQQMQGINPFTVTVSSAAAVAVLSLGTMVVIDHLGRRWFPIVGAALQVVALFTMAGLGTVSNPGINIKVGIITMMQLCIATYSASWAPVVHILSVELTSPRLRDLVYRIGNMMQVLVQFMSGFFLPYLLWKPYGDLQSKVGFVFGPIAVAAVLFSYFFVPECKGLSLEVVDRLFAERVPIRDFQRLGKEYMADNSAPQEKPKGESELVEMEDIAREHGQMQGP